MITDRERSALIAAARTSQAEADRIRAEFPEEDGAPDGPPRRSRDGLYEDDAAEYETDARLLYALADRL